jgi:class 3 adenylate cyclase
MKQAEAPREQRAERCGEIVRDPQAIRSHVTRVLDTPAFRRAPRMQRFLTFLVDELLAGRAEQLKEYTIAIGVFDKPVDFDPGTSAVIRVEAGRLRRMLDHYRSTAGADEDLELDIPKGSYVPEIRLRAQAPAPQLELAQREHMWLGSDERRLVTVLACAFCDERTPTGYSVSSDLLQWFDRFHRLSLDISARHSGTPGGAASDRILIYFGWPEALEDAAGRALTAALELIEAARENLGGGIGVRIGVATSEVVIRAECASMEGAPSVIGPAPLIAAALLSHGPINGVLASETTRRLVGDAFDFVPAGSIEGHERDPALMWRLIGQRALTTRFRAHRGSEDSAIIGRRDEIALLCGKWALSAEGEGQVVGVIGEAGIGKSMLAETATAGLEPGAVLRMQCSPHHSNSALYPFVELLRQVVPADDEDPEGTASLEHFLADYGIVGAQEQALLGALLARSESAEIQTLPASRHKDLTLRLLVRWLCAHAGRKPTLLLIEDLHWSDPTTLELLQDIARSTAGLPLMLLVTSRQDIGTEFARQTNFTSLRLSRLPKNECNVLISRIASATALSPAAREAILGRAEGIPLFIEELTRLYLGIDGLRSDASVPASLSDLLSSQLGRLGSARAVAQMASVIGRQFDRPTVELATARPGDEVEAALDRLLAAGIIVRTGGSGELYQFRHALLRDAAYESIIEQRRRELHGRVAAILIEGFPDIAANHPEVVAGHLADAGEHGEAFPFWVDAGVKAAGRYALAEAGHAYRRALDAIQKLPPSPANSERELDVLISLAQVVRSARGYGDEELLPLYERARSIAGELGDQRQLANAVYGLWTYAAGRGKWPDAVNIAKEFAALTSAFKDSQFEVEAQRLLGASAAFRGEYQLALAHFGRAMDVYDPAAHGPDYGFDPGAASAAYLTWILWHVDERTAAREMGSKALAIAESKGHAPTLAMVLSWLMFHAVCERDTETILAYNRRLQVVCAERECRYWQPFGAACAEWASFEVDGNARHLEPLLRFTSEFRERYFTSCLYLLAADICLRTDRPDQGIELTDKARLFIDRHSEHVWQAEALRLAAEFQVRLSPAKTDEARRLLKDAVETARSQGAVALERRAAERLAELDASAGSARRRAAR